ncbi:MAG TPA: hypothetical protein DEG17_06160 [Cyanobacteria bacterium UBA11149]|nr:hypothetical protein [Cyanobacteria bacterium UBA11367]HBE59151.1 hypothetical protein [Cyanobacteria bacterium UBA11366]HBR75698.1 hypothetical protein [Cyanobacteria bacterium UBA11159]HBS69676.1 hypothetical protein [Cyanobacteria bacterium UBA11153]HBW88461.1 hypothetical protein [Cyanobacteria bacterium UBA11149]HCA93783.1 hypothetical protein [Cyanobacteria bacterium UBA9226]
MDILHGSSPQHSISSSIPYKECCTQSRNERIFLKEGTPPPQVLGGEVVPGNIKLDRNSGLAYAQENSRRPLPRWAMGEFKIFWAWKKSRRDSPLAGDLGADCPVFTDDKISLEVTDFNKVDEEFATICELKQREIVRKLTTRIEV